MSNHLIHESSPYLLQHAENPVEWYPWGNEALQKAQKERKPILVSIGYSACHWCHVMAHESFEDVAVAKIMNDYFVNIKIDREERPDLDHIYMDAVQAMTGQGGWTLNVFLTPDAKPFFGGTYFPSKSFAGRASWKEILENVHRTFVEKEADILLQADNVVNHLRNANDIGGVGPRNNKLFSAESIRQATENILRQADTVWGGFGRAPKFPQTFSIQFLLNQYHFEKEEVALQQALLSLDKMIAGGIYDHIGGGFARYSTDEQWFAPHFEKMLYDNALMISTICDAYQLTQDARYKEVVAQTVQFLQREMMHVGGAFYAALDADSEGVEGKFYTWKKEEIESLLGEDAEIFCTAYGIDRTGNWEHTNIIWKPKPFSEMAPFLGISEKDLATILHRDRAILLSARNKRIRPDTDDKIILGWNGLLISALCKAFAAFEDSGCLQLAERCFQFLERNMFHPETNQWLHTWKSGEAKYHAFIDDYAAIIQACIALQEVTGNLTYIEKAELYTRYVLDNFSDEHQMLFYFTEKNQSDIVVQKKEIYDGATPSGNALMADALLNLSIMLDRPEWRKRAIAMCQAVGTAITRYPTSFGRWCILLQKLHFGINEIAVVGENCDDLSRQILTHFIPNKIVQTAKTENKSYPLLCDKPVAAGETFIYLCKDYACRQPVKTAEELLAALQTKTAAS